MAKKRTGPGRPIKADKFTKAFNVLCDEATFRLIEDFRARTPRMTQSEAVRQLVEHGLRAEGLLK